MTADWDEPRMELLKRLWISGETARTIAEKLGGNLTRNAVIGKAHRLGLTGKHGSKPTVPERKQNRVPHTKHQRSQRKSKPRSKSRFLAN